MNIDVWQIDFLIFHSNSSWSSIGSNMYSSNSSRERKFYFCPVFSIFVWYWYLICHPLHCITYAYFFTDLGRLSSVLTKKSQESDSGLCLHDIVNHSSNVVSPRHANPKSSTSLIASTSIATNTKYPKSAHPVNSQQAVTQKLQNTETTGNMATPIPLKDLPQSPLTAVCEEPSLVTPNVESQPQIPYTIQVTKPCESTSSSIAGDKDYAEMQRADANVHAGLPLHFLPDNATHNCLTKPHIGQRCSTKSSGISVQSRGSSIWSTSTQVSIVV